MHPPTWPRCRRRRRPGSRSQPRAQGLAGRAPATPRALRGLHSPGPASGRGDPPWDRRRQAAAASAAASAAARKGDTSRGRGCALAVGGAVELGAELGEDPLAQAVGTALPLGLALEHIEKALLEPEMFEARAALLQVLRDLGSELRGNLLLQ